jgi:hypothetical protein
LQLSERLPSGIVVGSLTIQTQVVYIGWIRRVLLAERLEATGDRVPRSLPSGAQLLVKAFFGSQTEQGAEVFDFLERWQGAGSLCGSGQGAYRLRSLIHGQLRRFQDGGGRGCARDGREKNEQLHFRESVFV